LRDLEASHGAGLGDGTSPLNQPRMKHEDIYSLIGAQEGLFKLPIRITDNWEWSMVEHVNTTILYKNSVFLTGKNDNKPFKNITRPILNLQYRAEGFDVKDIVVGEAMGFNQESRTQSLKEAFESGKNTVK